MGFLLKEDGDRLLKEDGDGLLLEGALAEITIIPEVVHTTSEAYAPTVQLGAAASDNADLSNLTIEDDETPVILTPSFNAATTSYTAEVDNEVESIDITATLDDTDATLTIGGNPATSGEPETVPLDVGNNAIAVVVTAEDETTQKTYTVNVFRLGVLDSVTVSPSTVNIVPDGSRQLNAIAHYTDGRQENVTTDASWASDDTDVATVDDDTSKGLVTGVALGTATITATFEDEPGEATVNVVESIGLSPAKKALVLRRL